MHRWRHGGFSVDSYMFVYMRSSPIVGVLVAALGGGLGTWPFSIPRLLLTWVKTRFSPRSFNIFTDVFQVLVATIWWESYVGCINSDGDLPLFIVFKRGWMVFYFRELPWRNHICLLSIRVYIIMFHLFRIDSSFLFCLSLNFFREPCLTEIEGFSWFKSY